MMTSFLDDPVADFLMTNGTRMYMFCEKVIGNISFIFEEDFVRVNM